MFARSLDLVAECGLTFLHVFPYSPRDGHAGRAHAAGGARGRDGARRAVAGPWPAAADCPSARPWSARRPTSWSNAAVLGKTPQFADVRVAGPSGEIVRVRMTARTETQLIGEAA